MPMPLDSEATAICNTHIGGFAEVAPPEKWHGCLGKEGKVTPSSICKHHAWVHRCVHVMHVLDFDPINCMHARNLEAILFPSTTNGRPTPFGLTGFLKLVPRAGAPHERQSGANSAKHPAWSFNTPKQATLSVCMHGMWKKHARMHVCVLYLRL